MNFNEYQQKAMSFRLESANSPYAFMGLVGEVGELYGAIAKAMRDDTEIDTEYVKKELGDILWFVAAITTDMNLNLSDVAQKNIEKLGSRKARGVIQGSGDDR
jgi:NTP pyrophosphatase (non-canonical NTP hydrolase)